MTTLFKDYYDQKIDLANHCKCLFMQDTNLSFCILHVSMNTSDIVECLTPVCVSYPVTYHQYIKLTDRSSTNHGQLPIGRNIIDTLTPPTLFSSLF